MRESGRTLEAGAEVFGDAADEEGWGEGGVGAAGDLVDPGEHAGGGGLAVGAGDDEATRGWRGTRRGGGRPCEVKGMRWSRTYFELGVAAGDGVADDDEVGARVEVGFGVGLEDGDAHGRASWSDMGG